MAERVRTTAGLLVAVLLAMSIGFAFSTAVRPVQAQDAALAGRVTELEQQLAALKAENTQVAAETTKVAEQIGKVDASMNTLMTALNGLVEKINTRQEMRLVRALGYGSAKAPPDLAVVNLGIEVQAASAAQALALSNSQANAIVGQLKALGLTEADIEQATPALAPITDDKRKITGYRGVVVLLVKIKNPSGAGALVDNVVKLGGNNFRGVEFKLSDPDKVKVQARENALKDARTRAEAYAKANGGTVGTIQEISEDFIPKSIKPVDPTKPKVLEEEVEVLVVFELK